MKVLRMCLLVLACVSAAQVALGQTCSCVGCTSTASIGVGKEEVITPASTCPDGQYPTVTTLNVQSTSGDEVDITTYSDAAHTKDYTGATLTGATCMEREGVTYGSSASSYIAVGISCTSYTSCAVQYNVEFGCGGTATPTNNNVVDGGTFTIYSDANCQNEDASATFTAGTCTEIADATSKASFDASSCSNGYVAGVLYDAASCSGDYGSYSGSAGRCHSVNGASIKVTCNDGVVGAASARAHAQGAILITAAAAAAMYALA